MSTLSNIKEIRLNHNKLTSVETSQITLPTDESGISLLSSTSVLTPASLPLCYTYDSSSDKVELMTTKAVDEALKNVDKDIYDDMVYNNSYYGNITGYKLANGVIKDELGQYMVDPEDEHNYKDASPSYAPSGTWISDLSPDFKTQEDIDKLAENIKVSLSICSGDYYEDTGYKIPYIHVKVNGNEEYKIKQTSIDNFWTKIDDIKVEKQDSTTITDTTTKSTTTINSGSIVAYEDCNIPYYNLTVRLYKINYTYVITLENGASCFNPGGRGKYYYKVQNIKDAEGEYTNNYNLTNFDTKTTITNFEDTYNQLKLIINVPITLVDFIQGEENPLIIGSMINTKLLFNISNINRKHALIAKHLIINPNGNIYDMNYDIKYNTLIKPRIVEYTDYPISTIKYDTIIESGSIIKPSPSASKATIKSGSIINGTTYGDTDLTSDIIVTTTSTIKAESTVGVSTVFKMKSKTGGSGISDTTIKSDIVIPLGSIIKSESIIKAGSIINGTTYGDTSLASELSVELESIIKVGSIIKAGSIINGTTYSDTILAFDITITSTTTIKSESIIKAGSIINGTTYGDTILASDITIISESIIKAGSKFKSNTIIANASYTEDTAIKSNFIIGQGATFGAGSIINGWKYENIVTTGPYITSDEYTAFTSLVSGSIIKSGSTIGSGSVINGESYSETELKSDLMITSNSTLTNTKLAIGSFIKSNSTYTHISESKTLTEDVIIVSNLDFTNPIATPAPLTFAATFKADFLTVGDDIKHGEGLTDNCGFAIDGIMNHTAKDTTYDDTIYKCEIDDDTYPYYTFIEMKQISED